MNPEHELIKQHLRQQIERNSVTKHAGSPDVILHMIEELESEVEGLQYLKHTENTEVSMLKQTIEERDRLHERDRLYWRDRTLKAEAEAVAMREALTIADRFLYLEGYSDGGEARSTISEALAPDAGKAVAERLELARLVEEMPLYTCIEHSEPWEGNSWYVIYRGVGPDNIVRAKGSTPLEALKAAKGLTE
jgi:hypothetical protein